MSLTSQCQSSSNPWLSQAVTIADITQELEGIATYHLAFRDSHSADRYHFAPGQFNMLYVPGVGEVAISISGDPALRGPLPHTIRVAGNVTTTLARMGQGGELGLRGPFGSAWPLPQLVGLDVMLVAGGVGAAPLRPAVYALLGNRTQYGELILFCGARTPAGLLFQREYADWQRRGMKVVTTVDRAPAGWTGNVGVVPSLLERLPLPRPDRTAVIMCGPEVMMRYTARAALARGIAEEQIWLTLERNMQCAVGLCGHCQLGPTFLCKDGPVFRHDQIAPFLNVESL
jgi:NAD(P)H-flavin reductase